MGKSLENMGKAHINTDRDRVDKGAESYLAPSTQ